MNKIRILVVGMNPSNRPTRKKIFKNSMFDRLINWMNLLSIDYFSFMNVCDRPGVVSIRDVDAKALIEASRSYSKIIALGGIASDALKRCRIVHFRLPHPSPRNRLLNDPAYKFSVLRDCRNYLYEQ